MGWVGWLCEILGLGVGAVDFSKIWGWGGSLDVWWPGWLTFPQLGVGAVDFSRLGGWGGSPFQA